MEFSVIANICGGPERRISPSMSKPFATNDHSRVHCTAFVRRWPKFTAAGGIMPPVLLLPLTRSSTPKRIKSLLAKTYAHRMQADIKSQLATREHCPYASN